MRHRAIGAGIGGESVDVSCAGRVGIADFGEEGQFGWKMYTYARSIFNLGCLDSMNVLDMYCGLN